MFNKILDILFPQFCLNCKREGNIVCPDCLGLIEIWEYQYCPFCQTPKRVIDRGKCASHQSRKLDGLFSATSYQNNLVKKMLFNFKYEPFLKVLSRPLAFLIISHFLASKNEKIFENRENSFLVPVPLSSFRERWRGFNQAELIAKELSLVSEIPVATKNLVKSRKTEFQAKLKKEQRQENVRGAFSIKNPEQIRGKTLFLIDDVFTTGATMEECALVLKQGGAKRVWGIAVAREIME